MIGLSITAIGQRPIKECIEIYYQLQQSLGLDYLELAIGSNCELNQIPKDIPLVIHNRCLYDNGKRLPFSLIQPATWASYKNQLCDRTVLALSVHPPRSSITWLTGVSGPYIGQGTVLQGGTLHAISFTCPSRRKITFLIASN